MNTCHWRKLPHDCHTRTSNGSLCRFPSMIISFCDYPPTELDVTPDQLARLLWLTRVSLAPHWHVSVLLELIGVSPGSHCTRFYNWTRELMMFSQFDFSPGHLVRRHLMSILGARANVMFIMKQMEATQSHLMSLKAVLCPLKFKKMSISELSGNPLGQEASRPLFIPEQGRYLVHNFTRNEPWSCGTSPAM